MKKYFIVFLFGLFLLPAKIYAQEAPSTLIEYIVSTTHCPAERISFVRRFGDGFIMNVCRQERVYRPRGDSFIDVGVRQGISSSIAPRTERSYEFSTPVYGAGPPPTPPSERRASGGSDRGMWIGGLVLFVTSYVSSAAFVGAASASPGRFGYRIEFAYFPMIPLVGPLIHYSGYESATALELVGAAFVGIVQLTGIILIAAGSRHIPASDLRATIPRALIEF